jgi:hypothetical protein
MNVTRDVIIDLLPLVLAGEGSDDSKALVRAYLEQDPELARIARARAPRLPSEGTPPLPAKEVEMKTLERTKKLLTWRSVAIGCGVFFALFPVVFSSGARRVYWLPLESPMGAAVSAGLALLFWAGFFWMRRKLRVKGR